MTSIIDIASDYILTHDLRPATQTTYYSAARAFQRQYGNDYPLDRLHNRDVLIWRTEFLASGRQKRSWNTYASHLRTLFQHAIKTELISTRQNPFTKTSVVPPKKRKKTVPHDAIAQGRHKLLELVEVERVTGKRAAITPAWFWLAVYETFHHTGVRLNSLLRIKLNDIDLKNQAIRVPSESDKTHREFVIPIPGPLVDHIRRITLWAQSLSFKGDDQLFNVNRFSEYYRRETMDINQIESMYKKLTRLVGTRMTPHRFRHTLATDLMRESDRNIHITKALLNHSNIATTMEYIEPDPLLIRQVMEDRVGTYRKGAIGRIDPTPSHSAHSCASRKSLASPTGIKDEQHLSVLNPPCTFEQLAAWIGKREHA